MNKNNLSFLNYSKKKTKNNLSFLNYSKKNVFTPKGVNTLFSKKKLSLVNYNIVNI
jgi:hypothetical protein